MLCYVNIYDKNFLFGGKLKVIGSEVELRTFDYENPG